MAHHKLNGFTVNQVKKVLDSNGSRIEAARAIGVTSKELIAFIDKNINPPAFTKEIIYPCVIVIERKTRFVVECSYKDHINIGKSVTEKVFVDKNQPKKELNKALAAAKVEMIALKKKMEARKLIGTVNNEEGINIPALALYVNSKLNVKVEETALRIAVGCDNETRRNNNFLCSTYAQFKKSWVLATDALVKYRGMDEKPTEWQKIPSAHIYNKTRKRLLDRKIELQKGKENKPSQ